MVPWLSKCFRQVQAEEVSKSRNKVHQTLGEPFSRAMIVHGLVEFVLAVAYHLWLSMPASFLQPLTIIISQPNLANGILIALVPCVHRKPNNKS